MRRVCVLGISAEGLRAIDRFVSRNLRPDFDTRRKPVLPAKRIVIVGGLDAGALAAQVIIIFGAESEVIQVSKSIV